MSTNTSHNSPSISQRKKDHIAVCRTDSGYSIESKARRGFESIQFMHNALPELSCEEVSTGADFLRRSIRLPLFISCMTGGTDEGYRANRELAIAAQEMRVPIGLGSMRILLSEADRIRDFNIRSYAPDIPIMGNIGAVQLRDEPPEKIKKLIHLLELDALVIHLNCGQELFQSGGDTDFRGLKKAISQAVNCFEIPLIVKETGFGIRPGLTKELLDSGVAFVDIAGSGGTNWILIEKSCRDTEETAASEFTEWGNATPVLLEASRSFLGKILASGGLRSGMDLAKAIALGAAAGGMALPFIRKALDGGADAVCNQIREYEKVLRSVMILTGSRTISELQNTPLLKSRDFEHEASAIKAIDL